MIDLGAERLIAAEKGNEKIAIEIKGFLEKSTLYAYHQALGQYRNYKLLMDLAGVDRDLFLAIPSDVYKDFFTRAFGKKSIEAEKLNLIVFNAFEKKIEKWVTHNE